MKKLFHCSSKYVLALLVLIFTLSLTSLIGDGIFLRPAAAEAEIHKLAGILDGRHPLIRSAIEVQKRHTERLMAIAGILGTGISVGPDGQPIIKVFASRTGIQGIPLILEALPVQVEVTGMIMAYADPTARFDRPTPIGVSTGHPDITAGTIGARVTNGTIVYALSNNHVYAAENDANIGDSAIQPGDADGGQDPVDRIGELADYEPINFSGGDNVLDAAIAAVDFDDFDGDGNSEWGVGISTPSDGYGTPSSETTQASVGLLVQKYGRTTGWTHGEVAELNVTVDVCYEPFFIFCLKSARFVNQIGISPGEFSDGGDSGSLIVTDDAAKRPVGLLFAGGDTRTFANPIDLVLERFNVTIDTGTTDTPPSAAIVNPTNDSVVSDFVTIQVDASDDNDAEGTLIVEVSIDGGAYQVTTYNTDSGFYEFDWDTSAELDGSHTIDARATDSADNITNASQVTITTDNVDEPPTANIVNPSDGSTVSGNVTIQVDASDDRDAEGTLVVKVSIDEGTPMAAGYNGSSGYYELSWDTSTETDGLHTIDASATDSGYETTDAAQISVTVDNSVSAMHVGDLDGTSSGGGFIWSAEVTVTVHETDHTNPVANASVSGSWSTGFGGTTSCTTDASGQCSVSRPYIWTGNSITFSVSDVTHTSLTYNSAENNDPDGDSDGTVINISRP